MDNKKNGIPKLRFPGFTGAWEQRKLGEVAKKITKGTTPHDKSWSGPVNYVKTESIDSNNGNISVIANTSLEEHEGYLKRSQLKENDVLFSIVGTLGRVGVVKKKDLPANTNQQICIIRPFEENSFFLLNALKTNRVKSFIKSDATIGAQPSLSLWQIEGLRIPFPNLEEQQKISAFFVKLDSLIALHQRKLEHLQEQKKGLLQKMFPKNGETVPEVRFPGFTDAWEQRKLGDYLSIPTKEPITDINELKLMTLKLNLEGITLTANRETLKLGATKYYKRHEGQLLYGKQNFFHGSIALIPKEAEGYATSGDVPALDISNVNGKYLVDYISRPSYFKAKEALATGTGSKRIHEKTLLNFKITVPSLEEQNAISDFITNYTNLITLHQRKLDHLELMKKGLLQQMFV